MTNPILTYLPLNGSLAGKDRVTGTFTATTSGAIRWKPMDGSRVNYFPETTIQSSELSTYTWGVQARNVTGKGHLAANSLLITNTVIDYLGFGGYTDSNWTAMHVGKQIQVSFSVRTNGNPIVFTLEDYNGTIISQETYSSEWERVVFLSEIHDGSFGFNFYSDNVLSAIGEWIEVSNIVFEIEPDLEADSFFETRKWFNPATGALGTVNASPSTTDLVVWVEEATTNLIENPSFDTNTNWWNQWGATMPLSRITYYRYAGSGGGMVVSTTGTHGIAPLYSASPAVAAGETVTLSAYIFNPSGHVTIGIEWVTAGNVSNGFSTTTTTTVMSDVWQRVILTVTAPANTAKARPYLVSSGSGHTWYVDAIQLEKKSYATSYCDGARGTGYTWTGTAHASSSNRAVSTLYALGATNQRLYPNSGSVIVKHKRFNDNVFRAVTLGGWFPSSGILGVLVWELGDGGYRLSSTVDGGVSQPTYSQATPDTSLRWVQVYAGWNWPTVEVGELDVAVGSFTSSMVYTAEPFGDYVDVSEHLGERIIGPLAVFSRPLTAGERTAYRIAIDNNEDLWTLYEQPPHALRLVESDQPFSLVRTSTGLND
jgi:hypothetical protein